MLGQVQIVDVSARPVRILMLATRALIVTALIPVSAFGSLAFGTFIPNVNFFGSMVAIGRTAALITDLVLPPEIFF